MAPERTFTYQSNTYVLWAALENNVYKLKVAQQQASGGYTFIGDLTSKSFDDSAVPAGAEKPSVHIAVLWTAAQNLQSATKTNGSQKPSAATHTSRGTSIIAFSRLAAPFLAFRTWDSDGTIPAGTC